VRIAAICLASLLIFAAASPPAHAECEQLRAHLDREARRARRWDLAWALTFGTFAVAQGGMLAAEWVPGEEWSDDAEAGLQVGIVKSSIASLSHIVLRLKVERPSGDDCASLARAVRETARHEKQAFWLNHAGSLLLNVGGLLYLGLVEDAWGEGWKGVALGYPIGLISTYTQPRASWHFAARLDDGGAQVVLSVRF
jgi:hypothetical protein